MKFPSKVVQFIWRVCSLCLPTTSRLAAKFVQVYTFSQWCRLYLETDTHTLFECEIVAATWVEAGLQAIINVMSDDNVFDVEMPKRPIGPGFDHTLKNPGFLAKVLTGL